MCIESHPSGLDRRAISSRYISMMRNCSTRAALRSLGAALMLAASLLVAPLSSSDSALAAPAEARSSRQSSGDMDQLLNEINGRRAMVGSPPLTYADSNANEAVDH